MDGCIGADWLFANNRDRRIMSVLAEICGFECSNRQGDLGTGKLTGRVQAVVEIKGQDRAVVEA